MKTRTLIADLAPYIILAALVFLADDHFSQNALILSEPQFETISSIGPTPVNRVRKSDRIGGLRQQASEETTSGLTLLIGCEFAVSPLVGGNQNAWSPMRCIS